MMRRIAVVGCGGAGKSTLARELGARLRLPVTHLDRLFWKPGWVERDLDEFAALQREVVERDAWVLDGNYSGTIALRAARADTMVFLDRSRWLCLARVVRRAWHHRRRTRPDLTEGCPEHVGWGFVKFIWAYPTRTRPLIEAALDEACRRGTRVHRLRNERQVRAFLAGVGPG